MLSNNRKQVGLVLVVVAGGAITLARAGNLTPPAGPISPTMHSLDEIYNYLTTPAPCPACTWQQKSFRNLGAGAVEVLPAGTSGVLHAVIFRGSTEVSLGGPAFASDVIQLLPNEPNIAHSEYYNDLNISFTNGVFVRGVGSNPSGQSMTVIFQTN